MIIKLTDGTECKVSRQDYKELSKHSWCLKKNPKRYAYRTEIVDGKRKRILMHRQIMNAESGYVVDHLNGDGLDNRRSNLRLCLHVENMRNTRKLTQKTTKYKGVSFVKARKRFRAVINTAGKQIHLGYFRKAQEAAKAYDEAARQLFGFDGVYNYPLPNERRAFSCSFK